MKTDVIPVPVQRGGTLKNSDVYIILYKTGMLGRWRVWQVFNKNKSVTRNINKHLSLLRFTYPKYRFELSKHGLARKALASNG